MPRILENLRRKEYQAVNGEWFMKFWCFLPEHGQGGAAQKERPYSVPFVAFHWVRDNVVLDAMGGKFKNGYIFSWPGPARLNRKGNADQLADDLRCMFGHLYAGIYVCGGKRPKIPFTREEVLGLANHLSITPKTTNTNTRPNRDNTVNPARLTKTGTVPGYTLFPKGQELCRAKNTGTTLLRSSRK